MATQNAQMAHKVEVVDEVKTRMSAATASIVSEYRGLTVAELADLRHALAAVGGDYKIFKNTLVRRAIDGGEYQPLGGVPERPERADLRPGRHQRGGQGAARLLPGQPAPRDQGRAGRRLAALDVRPGRAGRPAAPRGAAGPPGRCAGCADEQMAGLLKALPQNLAYGISALIEQKGGVDEAAAVAEPTPSRDRREAGSGQRPQTQRQPEAEAPQRQRPQRQSRAEAAARQPHPRRRRPPKAAAEARGGDRRAGRRVVRTNHRDRTPKRPKKERKARKMATLTKEEILDGIAELSVIQLSELLKDFEERFGVTAAAPVAVAAAAARRPAAATAAVRRRRSRPSTSSSPRPATRRSRSSRRSVPSRASASRRPRTWSRRRPSRCSRTSTRRTPTRPRPPSRAPAPPSRSSSPCRDPRGFGPPGRCPGRACPGPDSASRVYRSTAAHFCSAIGERQPACAPSRSRVCSAPSVEQDPWPQPRPGPGEGP